MLMTPEVSEGTRNGGSGNSLFHTIIKDFVLLSAHWKDSIKGKAILLRSRTESSCFHLHSLEILGKGHDDVATFALLDGIHGAKPERRRLRVVLTVQRQPRTHRHTTLMFVELAMANGVVAGRCE